MAVPYVWTSVGVAVHCRKSYAEPAEKPEKDTTTNCPSSRPEFGVAVSVGVGVVACATTGSCVIPVTEMSAAAPSPSVIAKVPARRCRLRNTASHDQHRGEQQDE